MARETVIESGGVRARIDAEGAQLMSLALDGVEYLWQGDERWWPRRAPVLFPIVGALRDDRVGTGRGPASMAQHGIARTREHRVVESGPTRVAFLLEDDEETRSRWPYPFSLSMVYSVNDGALSQTFRVENPGDSPMAFQLGGHPAFNVPVVPGDGEGFDDYVLEFSQAWTYAAPVLKDRLIDWGDRVPLVEDEAVLPLSHRLFDHDALVLQDVPGRTVTLRGTRTGRGMTVDFPGFDYCGVWSAAGDAPFVAIEPWTGTATGTEEDDVMEHKRGVTLLAPGDTFERTFTMRPF